MAAGTVHAILRRALSGSFVADSSLILASDLTVAALKMLAGIVLLRTLGPADQGTCSLIVNIWFVAGMIAGLGVEIAVVYYMGRMRRTAAETLVNAAAITGAASIALTLALWFSDQWLFGGLVPQASWSSLVLMEACVILLPLYSITCNIFLAERSFLIYCGLRLLNAVTFFTGVMVLVCVLQASINGALAAYVASYLATVVAALAVLQIRGRLARPRVRLASSRDLLAFGFRGYLGTLFQFLNYRLDLFLIAFFLDVPQVGIYTGAVLIAECLNYLPNAACTALFPRAAAASDQHNDLRTPIVARHLFYVSSLLAGVCLLLAPWGIPLLLGQAYASAVAPCQALLPGVVCLSVWKVVINDLAGRGEPQYKSLTSFVALVACVALNVILIPRLGIVGAGISSSVSYALAAGTGLYYFCRRTGVPGSRFLYGGLASP